MTTRSRQTIARRWLPALLLLGAAAAGARDPRMGELEVRQEGRTIHVRTVLQHAFSEEIEADLRSGLATVFRYQLRIHRVRRFWNDPVVARMDCYRSVTYRLLEKQYHLEAWQATTDPPVKRRTPDREEVETFLTRVESELRVMADDGEPEDQYYLSVRVVMKASQLPQAIKSTLFFIDWDVETPWRSSRFFRLPEGDDVPAEPRTP